MVKLFIEPSVEKFKNLECLVGWGTVFLSEKKNPIGSLVDQTKKSLDFHNQKSRLLFNEKLCTGILFWIEDKTPKMWYIVKDKLLGKPSNRWTIGNTLDYSCIQSFKSFLQFLDRLQVNITHKGSSYEKSSLSYFAGMAPSEKMRISEGVFLNKKISITKNSNNFMGLTTQIEGVNYSVISFDDYLTSVHGIKTIECYINQTRVHTLSGHRIKIDDCLDLYDYIGNWMIDNHVGIPFCDTTEYIDNELTKTIEYEFVT